MAAYNADEYIGAAIESILSQTFSDFELLILDDGSTDRTAEVISSVNDPRLRVIPQGRNLGLPLALNRLVAHARGRYLARMDADDVSLPDRLRDQVEYLNNHPDIDVCAMWCSGFGTSEAVNFTPPATHDELRLELFFGNPIPHPSVMLRRSSIAKGDMLYDPSFRGAEDYDLWARMAERWRFAAIQKTGLRYRFHERQATNQRLEEQRHLSGIARGHLARQLISDASEADLQLHSALTAKAPLPGADWIRRASGWATKLVDANAALAIYDDRAFSTRVARLLFETAALGAPRAPGTWSVMRNSRLHPGATASHFELLTFAVRCCAAYIPCRSSRAQPN